MRKDELSYFRKRNKYRMLDADIKRKAVNMALSHNPRASA